MSDSFNTGLGTGSNYNLNLETLIQTNVSTAPQGPGKIKDTASVSPPSENKYVFSPSNSPQIPPPMDNFDPNGMLQLEDMIKNYVGDVLTSASKLPDVGKAFLENIEEQLSQMTPEDIADLKTDLPPDQVIKMIRMAIFNADADVPESIKEAATKIREQSTRITGQSPDAVIRLINKQSAEFGYSILLKEAISKLGLSPEEQQQLLAADQMPEFADELSPEMQQMLSTAQAKALSGVQEDMGVSASWRPASSSAGFELGVANAFEKEIGDKLYDQFMSGKLSRAEYNDIRTMLYIPDSSPPNAAKLQGVLEGIETQAKSDVQKEWGFPDSYEPQIDSQDYTAILTGTFYATAKKAIAAQTPPLSAADQATLTAALSSPTLKEGLSPALKEILNSIETAATAKVIKQYGLPEIWKPDAEMLVNAPGLDTPKLKFMENVLALGFEYLNKLKELGGQAKTGTAKASGAFTNKVLNYLKVVSNALGALQEILFAASITQTNISKMLSRIEQDSAMGKLATEKKNIEDTKAKLAKEASMGPFKWIIMIILVLIMVFSAGALGPVVGTLIALITIGMAINSVVRGALKGNMNDVDLFKDMAATMGDLGTAMGSKAFGKFLAAIFTVVLCAACPWALIFDLSFGGGSTVTVFLEGIGIPPEIAGYIAMVVQVIAMIAVMILSAIFAPELLEGEAALMIATITEQIASMMPKIVMVIINAIIDVFEMVEEAVTEVINAVMKFLKTIMKEAKDAIMKTFVNTERATQQVEAATAKLTKIQSKIAQAEKNIAELTEKGADPKTIQKATKTLEKLKQAETSAAKNLVKAQDALTEIKQTAANLEKLAAKVEKAAEKVAQATTEGELEQAQAELKQAKAALRGGEKEAIKAAEKRSVQEIKDLIKEVTDLTDQEAEAVQKVKDLGDEVEHFEDMLRAAKQEKDLGKEAEALSNLADAKSALKEAQSARDEITLNLKSKSAELSELDEAAIRPLERMATAAEMTLDVVNNGIQINNNILQAQIALLKGELDAYLADVETFIKLLQSLIAKFQQSLQDLMKAISDLGSVMHESWVKASQATTTLSQAM